MLRKKNDIEMYSTHNEEKTIVAERFNRTLKNKIYEYVTSFSKNVFLINQMIYLINIIIHIIAQLKLQLKPDHVQSNTYIFSSNKTNDKNPKF